jgi:hypothetical protein
VKKKSVMSSDVWRGFQDAMHGIAKATLDPQFF